MELKKVNRSLFGIFGLSRILGINHNLRFICKNSFNQLLSDGFNDNLTDINKCGYCHQQNEQKQQIFSYATCNMFIEFNHGHHLNSVVVVVKYIVFVIVKECE